MLNNEAGIYYSLKVWLTSVAFASASQESLHFWVLRGIRQSGFLPAIKPPGSFDLINCFQ
jgi:hypothetical protein